MTPPFFPFPHKSIRIQKSFFIFPIFKCDSNAVWPQQAFWRLLALTAALLTCSLGQALPGLSAFSITFWKCLPIASLPKQTCVPSRTCSHLIFSFKPFWSPQAEPSQFTQSFSADFWEDSEALCWHSLLTSPQLSCSPKSWTLRGQRPLSWAFFCPKCFAWGLEVNAITKCWTTPSLFWALVGSCGAGTGICWLLN